MTDKRHAMSKVDTAWLRMEEPTNLMMITGIMGLDHDIDFQRLVDTIGLRFLAFPRFRYKAVYGSRNSYWEFDEDFDIYSHVRRTALPGDAGKQELQEFVSELASTPLDQSKPLWQFHLVENHSEGPVLITRIHHCYADGIALIQVLLSLTDSTPEPRASARSPQHWKRQRMQESNIFRRFLEPARDGLDTAVDWGQKALEEMLAMLRQPEQVGAYANEAIDIADELATTLLLSDDPPTRFKGRLGARKRVAWTEPLPLDEVKAVGRALGCTVNDVLIASATGALNHYLRCCGEDPEDIEIRATVPVNLRPLEHAKDLGNHFGLVYLPLPVGLENPLQRLLKVHEHMEELKNSRQAVVAFGLLAALGMGPAALQKPMLDMMSRKASAVLTNVPGPRRPLYMAGTAVREMMFWVPQNGSIGMGISILSYNQQVYMGLITDRRLVPDPEAIVSRFRAEFDKLLYLVLQMPDGDVTPDDVQDWLLHWAAQGHPGLDRDDITDTEHENILLVDDDVELSTERSAGPAKQTEQAQTAAASATGSKQPAARKSAHKKTVDQKPASKKAVDKKAASKKAASKKAVSKKAVSKKAASKKAVSKKAAGKKAASKKAASKKAASKKPVSKKAVSKKAVSKKAVSKKAAGKKAAGEKSTKKKTTAKKKPSSQQTSGKKSVARKSSSKPTAAGAKARQKQTSSFGPAPDYQPRWKLRGKKSSKKVSKKPSGK